MLIIILGSDAEKLHEAAKKLGCEYIQYDMTSVERIKTIVKQLFETYEFNILVNSAGFHGFNAFGSVTEETWDKVFDINVKGMYFISQEFVNQMIHRGLNGHILNVSSASSLKPGITPYEISKRAVNSITQDMAYKLIKHGIVVNGIAPAPTATLMLNACKTFSGNINLTWKANPSGRMSAPEEIANLALFMVSVLGDGVVGDTFFITGGSGTICIDK